MAMRIGFRIAQFGGDPILELLRNEMLQTLSFLVNLFPCVIEHIVEEALQQPVVPHDLQCALPAGWRKANAVVPTITHE